MQRSIFPFPSLEILEQTTLRVQRSKEDFSFRIICCVFFHDFCTKFDEVMTDLIRMLRLRRNLEKFQSDWKTLELTTKIMKKKQSKIMGESTLLRGYFVHFSRLFFEIKTLSDFHINFQAIGEHFICRRESIHKYMFLSIYICISSDRRHTRLNTFTCTGGTNHSTKLLSSVSTSHFFSLIRVVTSMPRNTTSS